MLSFRDCLCVCVCQDLKGRLGTWKVVTPTTIPAFSAVCYLAARDIFRDVLGGKVSACVIWRRRQSVLQHAVSAVATGCRGHAWNVLGRHAH